MTTYGNSSREQEFVDMIAQRERKRCVAIVEAAITGGRNLYDVRDEIQSGGEQTSAAARAQSSSGTDPAVELFEKRFGNQSGSDRRARQQAVVDAGVELYLASRPHTPERT